tara:strand:- start:195 stop:1232 length:1038 start_codon:yes stop_codon:yes gene_type:complete
MLCCGKCIGDQWLFEKVISSYLEGRGACPLCGAANKPLMKIDEVDELRDRFEALLGIYRKDENGLPILKLFRDDWCLFEDQNINDVNAIKFLSILFGDDVREGSKFVPSKDFDVPHMESWSDLREELKHVNRFFPKTEFDLERLQNLLKLLSLSSKMFVSLWFRSRIERDKKSFSATEMGAPPPKLAASGRANPVGIPYLYLSSDEATAVAEVRPHPGDLICVAKFNIPSDANFVDLRNPRATVSPFLLDDEQQIGMLRRDIGFLEGLAKELRTPVLPNDAAVDYIPSQYLCELIKDSGFDGVVYGSSVGDGINLAIFNPSSAKVGLVEEFSVTRVKVSVEKSAH